MQTMQVPYVWQIHFELKCAPGHGCSLYGFKSEAAMKPALTYLENNAEVLHLEWRKVWKLTKRSRWMKEVTVIR
jgi:hypothetical protein